MWTQWKVLTLSHTQLRSCYFSLVFGINWAALWMSPFLWNPIITFAQIAYSVELIQPRCVLSDEAYVTQLLSCCPAEGQLSINCLCHVFRICTSKEGTNSTITQTTSAKCLKILVRERVKCATSIVFITHVLITSHKNNSKAAESCRADQSQNKTVTIDVLAWHSGTTNVNTLRTNRCGGQKMLLPCTPWNIFVLGDYLAWRAGDRGLQGRKKK